MPHRPPGLVGFCLAAHRAHFPQGHLLRMVQQPPDDAAPNPNTGGRTFGDQTSGGPMIEHIRIIWALIRFWIL